MRLLLFIALAGIASAQAPRPKREGTIVIQPRDASTQAPLPQAGCQVRSFEMGMTKPAGGGPFEFGVPAASYELTCELTGYSAESRRIQLSAGKTERVTIDLTPNGSLEGIVRDEEGRPMNGVIVYSHQTARAPRQLAITDADGRWRGTNVVAGDYDLQFRVPYEIRKATVKRNVDTGEVDGYPHVTYFPGVDDADGATTVHASSGAALTGFDVRLRRVRLVELSVRLEDRVTHDVMRKTEAGLVTPLSPHADHNYAPRKPGEDGLLHFDLLRPGRYEVSVGYEETGGTVRYIAPVEVGKAGLAGFVVTRPPLQTIAVRVEPLPGDASWDGSVQVLLMGPGLKNVELHDSLPGSISGLPPGSWRVYVASKAKRIADGKKLAVAEATFGPQDALTRSIDVAESGNPVLTIRLTAETGAVTGVVERREGAKENAAYLRRAGVGEESYGIIGDDGGFLFPDLAPGKYEVCARVSGIGPQPNSRWTPVEVKAGETVAVRLQVP